MDMSYIYEELGWFDDGIVADKIDLQKTVAEVVSKLPEEAQDFVLDKVRWFTISAQNYAIAFPFSIQGPRTLDDGRVSFRIIMLSPSIQDAPLERAVFTIAHEIAHSWLEHGPTGTREDFDTLEAEADALSAEWGFPRPQETQG
jgi:Zn-dependent peptidase ImmA (M78 family)